MTALCKDKINLILRSETFIFWAGGSLGAVLFLCIFGCKVLDVTYDAWLLSKADLSQHYLGWCFFRNADWMFPFGCANTLSYPLSSSVIFTDSIPLFAVFFKLFRSLLPATFQYFGWFGFMVYFLQGAISALLIKRLSGNSFYALMASLLFLFAAPLTQRIFSHTALSAQFIILLCLLMLLTNKHPERIWRNILVWSLLGVLASGTHFFFVPIVLLFLLFYAIGVKIQSKQWVPFLSTLLIPMAMAALTTWLLGGFTSEVAPLNSAGASKLGESSANLNTFYNSLGWTGNDGFHLPMLKCAFQYQYEGFAYLGLGLLAGLCLLSLTLIVNAIHPLPFLQRTDFGVLKHTHVWMLICLSALFLILALSPIVTFNDKILFTYPLLKPVKMVWIIFRSSGRFIWPVFYILMLTFVIGCYRVPKHKWLAVCCLVICLAMQVADLWPWMQKNGSKRTAVLYTPLAEHQKLEKMMQGKERICFSQYYKIDQYTDILQLAARHKAAINSFYFARQFGGYCDYVREKASAELTKPSPTCLYVFVDGLPADSLTLVNKLDITHVGPYTLGTAKETVHSHDI